MSLVCQRCEHENTDDAKFCLNCGGMLEVEVAGESDPLIGKILLGRYRVNHVLGEGGMGKVYTAEQKMGTAVRRVAIKTLHPELSGDPQIVARFHRECETVIQLHHPNTVQFYDFGELPDKTLFIVMEFIKGEDLAHVLQRGPVEIGRADKLLIQICGSLHEAHQMGIVHRDLKPENVLLTERGGQTDFVKVLDFGIAKRNEVEDDQQAKLTKQGMVLGTPPYMSPEQFSGQSLDYRSDIYSLGVMTYEMITGHLPFSANTPWEWATKHLTEQPTPIESYAEGAPLPEQKRVAIMRALSKNKEERQSGVLEFMHEFTGIGDAQAAWTMATSAGIASSSGVSQAGPMPSEPRQPVGTPQPMQTGGHGTGPTMPAMDATHGQGPSTGQMATQGGGSGLAKWIALAAVLILLMLGGGGAGLYFLLTRSNAIGQVGGPGMPGSGGNGANVGSSGLGVPTTPQEQSTSSTPGEDEATDSVEEASGDGDATEDAEVSEGEAEEQPAEGEDTAETSEEEAEEEEEEASSPSRMTAPRRAQPSVNLDRARNAIRDAEIAMGRSDIEGAIRAVAQAQRAAGRRHPVLRGVRTKLGRKASNMVGIMMQQGRCAQAQQLYRRLRAVGAHRPSAQHFSADWCRRP